MNWFTASFIAWHFLDLGMILMMEISGHFNRQFIAATFCTLLQL